MVDQPKRVAIITGCGKAEGIGCATARLLAASGIAVVVADIEARGAASDNEPIRNTEWQGLDSLVNEIQSKGGKAIAVRGDISSEEDTERMVKAAMHQFGRVDILVNNAGAPHGLDRGDIEGVPVSAWDLVMEINARGAFLLCRAVIPSMRAHKWGRIVNVSSVAGLMGFPYRGAYSASKAAVIGFTRSLAIDVAAEGITVNAICPGSILTARALSTAKRNNTSTVDDVLKARALTIPMKRHGNADEVAAAIAFFASPSSSYVTGQTLTVDGGGLPPE